MVSKLQKMRDRLMAKKGNKGFTLVELIVVIVILAILVGVTIGGVYGYVNKSRINTDINNASAIASAMAPLSTMKNVTVSATAPIDISAKTDFTGVADDWTSLGLTLATDADATKAASELKAVQNMFPQGIDAPKNGGTVYRITYTTVSATDKHVTSVKVEAGTVSDGTFTPLEAQE